MPSLPLVSVITPSFNQARFLETAIRSVLGQGYPRLEYLIVDGGSTDGSVDVIRRYAPALTWWVSEPDHGQAEAINKGLRRARGEIVAWLNSDDAYAPQAIAAAVAAFQTHPEAVLVFGQGVSFDAAGRPFRLLPAGPWGRVDLMTFHILTQPAVFMRRSAVVKAGFLDEDFHFLLDHRLWLKMSLLGELVHVPRVWAFARYHPAAKNAAQAARFGDEALRLARWLATSPAFAEDYARHKRKIWAAAHRFRARYLLDAGRPAAALAGYSRALSWHPPTAWQEAHRMAFALAALVGLGRPLRRWYYRRAWAHTPPQAIALGVENVDAFWGRGGVEGLVTR